MKNRKFGSLIRKINWYPPFLGAGIRVASFSDDHTRFEVQLRARWYNRNLFGTHFGGALYMMSDPFYVFIVAMNLGRDYVVWDKSAAIDFVRPAKGTITGVFEISPDRLDDIRADIAECGKNTYHFETTLTDEEGVTVARVRKEVYVRLKSSKPER